MSSDTGNENSRKRQVSDEEPFRRHFALIKYLICVRIAYATRNVKFRQPVKFRGGHCWAPHRFTPEIRVQWD